MALITASHVAAYLEEVRHNPSGSSQHVERLLTQVFAMRPSEVFRVLADVDQRVCELSVLLGIDCGRMPPLESILADAQELLAQIAIAGQLRLVNGDAGSGSSARLQKKADAQIDPMLETQWRDPLSGAFNRAWLESSLGFTIEQAQLHQVSVGMLIVEIKHTHSFSETDGPRAGGELLKRATRTLQRSVRLADSVARYDGHQFVITLKDVNSDMLQLLSEQIRDSIRTEFLADSPTGSVACRIGAVFHDPQEGVPVCPKTLIKQAERALNHTRSNGADQVFVTSLGPRKCHVPAPAGVLS